jgi:hypothetical protein
MKRTDRYPGLCFCDYQPMREFIGILTSLVFASHAALGCCAHHAHAARHGSAGAHGVGSDWRHDHAGHEHNDTPVDEEEHSSGGCDDGSCVFLKSDLAKVHVAGNHALCLPADAACAVQRPNMRAAAISFRTLSVDARSAELYVWHCALLI